MKQGILIIMTGIFLWACSSGKKEKETPLKEESPNPFFTEWNTPFGAPPFDKIKNEHYIPAFKKAIKDQEAEIKKIIDNSEAPTFENTIVALDYSGSLLRKVQNVFSNIKGADTDSIKEKIAQEITPLVSKHHTSIYLNDKLFKRIKAVNENEDKSKLSQEDKMLIKHFYKKFVRSGAELDEAKKNRLKEINERLSTLSLTFGQNKLADVNDFKLFITDEKNLAGLPESSITGAKDAAIEEGRDDAWLFTVQKPSMIPFLQYAENRELREKLFKGYISLGNNNNDNDNKKIVAEMVKLRVEKAQIMGYDNYAQYVLEDRMAKTPENVYSLITKLMDAAVLTAKEERAALQEIIKKSGGDFNLNPWDWWFYAEKLRKEKYNLDDEILRPYFELENVINGAFGTATKLYGITFEKRNDIPLYHKDASVYEVKESTGEHIGLLYTDWHPRASKRSGAWMTSFRKQHIVNDKKYSPIISIVCNFSKPSKDKPALLTFDEVSTLFHEFGHALHGLLSDCHYNTLSGTSVTRDFVELPSQIMENWAAEPEVLKDFAKHYKTDESIPDELIKKMDESSKFNQGFAVTEFMAAAILDMDYHMLENIDDNFDVLDFEKKSMEKMGMIDEIVVRYRSTYFSHIFAGGYAVGYYGYTWAEILDADAFAAFKENGIFDQETAKSFRENILSKGGTVDADELYKKFRGCEPAIEPFLKRKGLKVDL